MKWIKYFKMKKKNSYKAAAIVIAAVFVSTSFLPELPAGSGERFPWVAMAEGEDGTDAPATDAPATEVPGTEAPVTEAPTTEVPTTEQIPQSTTSVSGDTTETLIPATEKATEKATNKTPITIFGTLPNTESGVTESGGIGWAYGTVTEKATNKTTEAGYNVGNNTYQIVTTAIQSSGVQVASEDILKAREAYQKAIQERTQLQIELNELLAQQNDIITVLKKLDDEIIEYEDKISELKDKQNIAEKMVISLQADLDVANEELAEQYETLKKHIQNAYENGNYSYLDALLNAVDYIDILNKTEYIQQINAYDMELIHGIQEKKLSIGNRKLMMKSLIEDIEVLKQTYESEEETLQMVSNIKEQQIAHYQQSIDYQNQEIGQMTAVEKQLNDKLTEMEQKAQTTITYAVFSYSGAKLLWPIPSSTYITSYFGGREAPTEGATTNHQGIDIGGDTGDSLIASADGIVICAEHTGSGGETVMIDIGSGITLTYCHLSAYNCKYGQRVKAGDVIGYVGETGVATGPHLHFGVRVNGVYTDPAPFLGLTY